jgi:iron(III) transport system ATP-binding protein
MGDMAKAVWDLQGVTLAGRNRPRLHDMSLTISDGVTAVMGSSGAGKSSLLGLLTEFEKPDAGIVEFRAPDTPADVPLFWSPQDDGLWPHLSAEQHIEYVLSSQARLGRSPVEWLGRSPAEWLELFCLEELKNALPESLSQGERSRLAIARSLASEAAVLVLDEPLVHVDPLLAHRCWQLIAEHIERCGTTVVFSTHDPDAVLKFAQNVVCLDKGTIAFAGAVNELHFEPPTKELAWLLGPCNWLNQDAIDGGKVGVEPGQPDVCVRPSSLALVQDSNARFVVESVLNAAFLTEVKIRERESERRLTVFVSQRRDEIVIGAAVRLVADPASPS